MIAFETEIEEMREHCSTTKSLDYSSYMYRDFIKSAIEYIDCLKSQQLSRTVHVEKAVDQAKFEPPLESDYK